MEQNWAIENTKHYHFKRSNNVFRSTACSGFHFNRASTTRILQQIPKQKSELKHSLYSPYLGPRYISRSKNYKLSWNAHLKKNIYIGIQKHSYSNIERSITEQFPEMDGIECKYSDEACYEYEIKGFHTSDRGSVLQHLVLW